MDIAVSPFTGLLPETGETAVLLRASACATDMLLRSSSAFRTTLSVCLHAQVPMLLVWGNASHCIYNDACIALLGERHPAAFGQSLATLTNTRASNGVHVDANPALNLSKWACSPALDATSERLGTLYVPACMPPTCVLSAETPSRQLYQRRSINRPSSWRCCADPTTSSKASINPFCSARPAVRFMRPLWIFSTSRCAIAKAASMRF